MGEPNTGIAETAETGKSGMATITKVNSHGAQAYKDAPLPNGCPPGDAQAVSKRLVLRLVPANPASEDDFRSHAAKGKGCPKKCDPCRWAACSVFAATTKKEKLAGLAKLPNLSHMRYVAYVEIDESAGKAKPWPDDQEHISFWAYASFDAPGAVKKMEPL